MNKNFLKKIISSISLLGIGVSSNAYAYATDDDKNNLQKILQNFISEDPSLQNEKEIAKEKNSIDNDLRDYDILRLALNPSLLSYKKGESLNLPSLDENKGIYDQSYDENMYVINSVEYQRQKALTVLEGWEFMKIAYKGEKYDVYEKLSDFGFKDLSKLKRNSENYLNYINNFFAKETDWNELILDGVPIRRHDIRSIEIQYYLKLFIFYDRFSTLDSNIERYKNAYYLLNDKVLLSSIKEDVNNYFAEHGVTFSGERDEFYVWAWINIVFGEASLQWRSMDISLHREDPSNPLNKVKFLNETSKHNNNMNGVKKTLVVELH